MPLLLLLLLPLGIGTEKVLNPCLLQSSAPGVTNMNEYLRRSGVNKFNYLHEYLQADPEPGFHVGRISEGQFEYPQLNG